MMGHTGALALAVLFKCVVVDLALHHRAKNLTGLVRGECAVDELELIGLLFHDHLEGLKLFGGSSGDGMPASVAALARGFSVEDDEVDPLMVE